MKLNYQQSSFIKKTDLNTLAQRLEPYRKTLQAISQTNGYHEPESSIHLPNDPLLLEKMYQTCERIYSPTLQYVIVVGIGGSNLGAQAVYEAIAGSMNLLGDRLPKLIFLDTVTDEKMTAVTRVLERLVTREDFLVIAISKSGTTTETIVNTEILWAFTEEHFGSCQDRFVFITDEGSKLWEVAQNKNMECLSVPKQVGGRFSIFSAVGLLPLHLAGIDIKALINGGKQAVSDGISSHLLKNHSLVCACLTYLHHQQGRHIHNTFLFSPKFETLGKWYRQLMCESLGKERDLNGNIVYAGIIPIVSIGSTDLHSMAQLYWGGPDVIYTNLVYSFTGDIHRIPQHLSLPGLVADIQGSSLECV